jgi:hypothetical protein
VKVRFTPAARLAVRESARGGSSIAISCLVEIELTHPNGLAFRTARVIGHGKTRRASLAQATISFARYDEIGHFYTGHITETLLRPVVIIDDEARDAFRYPR